MLNISTFSQNKIYKIPADVVWNVMFKGSTQELKSCTVAHMS